VAQTLVRLEAEVRQTQKQYEELKKLLETSQAEIKALKAGLDALKGKIPKAAP
jgi:peptidoglycan hydrolase CwlO-like protein